MTARLTPFRTFLLTLALAGTALAQQGADPAAPPEPAAEATPASIEADPQIVRNLSELLRAHPPELSQILRLDPSLLASPEFVGRYPEVAAFVARHPELGRNPRLHLRQAALVEPGRTRRGPSEMIEALSIFGTIAIFLFAAMWLIRTIVEQRRWSRLARVQSEVHGKLLERFTGSQELLAYIESPAGRRFLESAPIQVATAEPRSESAPVARMLWPLQIGIVVAAGSIGVLLVSGGFGEDSHELFALGVIGLCIGVGFAGSAVASFLLSRRLGLWQPRVPGQLGSE